MNDISLIHLQDAIKKKSIEFSNLSLEQRDNFELGLFAVKTSAYNYAHLSERLRNDSKIAHVAFTRVGWPLKFAGDKIKSDLDLVTRAVTSNDFALEFASKELQNNPEVVKVACVGKWRNGDAFKFATSKLRSNKEFIKLIYPTSIEVLKHVDKSMFKDFSFVVSLVELNFLGVKYLNDRLKNNKKLAEIVVKINPRSIFMFSKKIQTDPKILMLAYENGL